MRLGILTIGSLFWSPDRVRCRWRQNRLSCTEKREVSITTFEDDAIQAVLRGDPPNPAAADGGAVKMGRRG